MMIIPIGLNDRSSGSNIKLRSLRIDAKSRSAIRYRSFFAGMASRFASRLERLSSAMGSPIIHKSKTFAAFSLAILTSQRASFCWKEVGRCHPRS